ncbi:MAG: isochorismatase family protein, partial [Candidatus Limnocylindrales bacterium]
EFHPGLAVAGPVIRKGSHGEDGYSGFTMRDPLTGETVPTGLDATLRDLGIRRVVIAGLATDYCVRASGLDARALGYRTIVLERAIAAVDLQSGDGARALDELRAAGVTVT